MKKKILKLLHFFRVLYYCDLFPFEKELSFIRKNFQFNISIDIGANRGMYSHCLSSISKKVYSYEPNKNLSKYLSITSKSNVFVFNYLISDNSDILINFYIPKKNIFFDNHALGSVNNLYKNSSEISVITKKIDDLKLPKKVDFIKIDVEGHELSVINGMMLLLERDHPLILMELELRHNPDIKKVYDLIVGLNYKSYVLKHNKLISFSFDDLLKNQKKNLGLSGYINNIFFK